MSAVPKTEVKDETPEVTARRLKKRELDRKAQRMARERTKSRIAHLEELVGHLSHNDTNAEVSHLMERLLQTTQERDKLVGVLASLGTTIRHHTDALTAAQAEGSSSAVVAAMQALSDRSERNVDVKPFDQQAQAQAPPQVHNHGPLTTSYGHREPYAPTDPHMQQHPSAPPPPAYGWGFENPDLHQQHQHAQNTAAMPTYSSQDFDKLPPGNPIAMPRSDSEFSSETNISGEHYMVPPSTCHPQCECLTIIEPPSGHPGSGRNTWRDANIALGKSVKLLEADAVEAEDRASQDTPVRAIVEGWDSVERAGLMTDSWRKLRVLDDICFSKCGAVERLAVLRMMHLLICCHGDPSPERLATLPRWYRKRPSQHAIPHPYAIDFLVWPGIRERFVFSQHRYCTNQFWELFRSNLTLVWQFGFNDCFMQNTATGRFELAPLFEERIRDIKAWTMNADFLNQYPELADDIPVFTGIPAKPSTPRNALAQQQARWSTTPRPIKRDVDEPAELAPQQQQQQQQRQQAEDDLAKSSALVVTTQAPAFADDEYMAQSPDVHVTMAGQPTYAYDQSGVIVPTTLAPADLGPGGQHVYPGGSWFYTYCQPGYT
ncbi:hypothetical protein VDGD_09257 [Verticillium dahliae]|nr:hypothetical protein VDGD_09257 [Verticillium dahliae]